MTNKLLLEVLKDNEIVRELFYSSLYFTHVYSCTNSETFREYLIEKYNPKEIDFKDKIKVYIKEPNIPEYIQLWDKFEFEDIVKYCKGKNFSNMGLICSDIDKFYIGFINSGDRIYFRK